MNKTKKVWLSVATGLCIGAIGIYGYLNSESRLYDKAVSVCENGGSDNQKANCFCDVKELKRVFDGSTYKKYLKAVIEKDGITRVKLEYELDTANMMKYKMEHNKCIDGYSKQLILKYVQEYEAKNKKGNK